MAREDFPIPPSHLSPRGCFSGSWMMVGLVGPALWDACSKLLFGNSRNTVTNPRDAELPTPSAGSLQEEVLFRQVDTGASEPAQTGRVQPSSAPSLPDTASSPPAQERSRGHAGGLRCSLDSSAEYCKSNWHWQIFPE